MFPVEQFYLVLFVLFVPIQAQGVGRCFPPGRVCYRNEDCCYNLCSITTIAVKEGNGGVCVIPRRNTSRSCSEEYFPCASNVDCCAGMPCVNNICQRTWIPVFSTPTPTCKRLGEPCLLDQCCGNAKCIRDAYGHRYCTTGGPCVHLDVHCTKDRQCCSNYCDLYNQVCSVLAPPKSACGESGDRCYNHHDCCPNMRCGRDNRCFELPQKPCMHINQYCELDSQCCSKYCDKFLRICKPTKSMCRKEREFCRRQSECCYGYSCGEDHRCHHDPTHPYTNSDEERYHLTIRMTPLK